jgi:hypothetical protein
MLYCSGTIGRPCSAGICVSSRKSDANVCCLDRSEIPSDWLERQFFRCPKCIHQTKQHVPVSLLKSKLAVFVMYLSSNLFSVSDAQ